MNNNRRVKRRKCSRILSELYEPPLDKTNKVSVRPAKTQISLGIRPFAVRMKKTWVLSYPLNAQRRLIRLGGCPGWSESLLCAHSFCWFCHVAAHMSLPGHLQFYRSLLSKWNGFIRVLRCFSVVSQRNINSLPFGTMDLFMINV